MIRTQKIDIDGNVAALTKYMNDQEATETAWEYLLKLMDHNLDEIERLTAECRESIKDSGYNFNEDLKAEIEARCW